MIGKHAPWPAGLSLALLAFTACSDGTGPGHRVDASGGVISSLGDSIRLTIPSGALTEAVRITVERIASPPIGNGLVGGTAIRIGPPGTVFALPVAIELSYDPERVPGGATEADLRLHGFVDGSGWGELAAGSTRNAVTRRISGQLSQDGIYAILPAVPASVELTDTARAPSPITPLRGRALVGAAYDVAGAPLVGVTLTLTSLDPSIATAQPGLAVAGLSPGSARMVLAAGDARDTLSINVTFGWRRLSLTGGGNAPWHSCGIGHDDQAYCWGENGSLQAGVLAPDSIVRPTQVSGAPQATSSGFAIASGSEATCYMPDSGWVCWGIERMHGMDNPAVTLPRAASWLPEGTMHLGYGGGCITTAPGEAYCWGVSPGDGSSVKWTPVRVQEPGGPWAVVRPGLNLICGLTAQQRAYCWGSNLSGSGGHGLAAGQFMRYLPNAVAATEAFVDLRVGANAACALAGSGEVWCWGANYLGLLGDTAVVVESPVPILAPLGALRFRTSPANDTFGLGSSFACGLTASDEAYCWGGGTHGELGNGSAESSPVATKVSGDHRFRSIAVGANHACGITAYGAAYCWGWNFRGALGISSVQTGSSQLVPLQLDTP